MTTARPGFSDMGLGSIIAIVFTTCGAFFDNVDSFSAGRLSRSASVEHRIIAWGNRNDALTFDERNDKLTTIQSTPPVLWNDEDEDSWKEWHYSFSRNGFTDFLPQFSENLNCLLVGDMLDNVNSRSRLPWDQHQQAKVTTRFLIEETQEVNERDQKDWSASENNLSNDDGKQLVATEGVSVSPLVASKFTSMVHNDAIESSYDCILDRGLANAILSNGDALGSDDLDALMEQASQAICYNGIYVMLTNHLLSTETKDHLTRVGETLGMQWKFDLDGISNESISVSVARKYFNGELPSFGRLATTDRSPSHHSLLREGLAP